MQYIHKKTTFVDFFRLIVKKLTVFIYYSCEKKMTLLFKVSVCVACNL